jgi:hypothetical protein
MTKLFDFLGWLVFAVTVAMLIPIGTKTTVTQTGTTPGGFVKTSTKVERVTLWTMLRDWARR